MQEKTCKTVRLCYGIALSLMTAVTGALFIWQTLDIYLSGGSRPFTREIVLERLNRIAPAFWIWVVMVAVGFIIWEVFAVSYKRTPLKTIAMRSAVLKSAFPKRSAKAGLPRLKR